MSALASKDIVFGSLSSVNVEITGCGPDLTARVTRVGTAWWRWGWRDALSARDTQYKRRGMSMNEVIKKYALCPVNWMAPEVLRGEKPLEASDVYSFGLLLWEILYRAVPYAEYSIAQIIGAVGYG